MVKNFPEITIGFSNPVAYNERIKIAQSKDIRNYLLDIWQDDIEYRESVYAVMLDRGNHVLGYLLVSKGGISGTIVDVRMILQAALLASASSILLAHNHPSGTLRASSPDISITTKLNDASKLLDICLLDHLIVTKDGYLSLADEGMM